MNCMMTFCDFFCVLMLVITGLVWALIWTGLILSGSVKELSVYSHPWSRYVTLGVFEFVVVLIIVCVVVRARRRRLRERKLKREASRILHTEGYYGAIQRQQNQLFYIQDKLAGMDKDDLKRFRDSIATPQSPKLYPSTSLSQSFNVHSKVKLKLLKTSCSTRSPMLMKILLVGNPSTGKSSLLKRWLHGQYSDVYRATLGADFVAANLELESDGVKLPSLSLQAWDIAGQERFASMTHLYYNKAVCFCVVYDMSNHSTLQAALWWISDIQSKIPNPFIVLVANKLDLKDHQKILSDDLAIMESTNGLMFFEVSAKTGENVNEMFRSVVLNTFLTQIQDHIEPTKHV